jgi:hypothetical protein
LDPLVPNQVRYQTALHSENWCRHEESNPGPTAYKAAALPAEL